MANNEDGIKWLNEQLRQLGIDRAELARRGDFKQATLTNVYSGKRGVGKVLARGIAQGLGVPQDVVFREFGLMDERENGNEEEAQLFTELLDDIQDNTERRKAVGLVTALLRQVAIAAKSGQPVATDKASGKGGKAPRRAAAAD